MESTAPLFALSPLDGRYAKEMQDLIPFFSESALMHARLVVEIEWLLLLSNTKTIPEVRALKKTEQDFLKKIIQNFDGSAALRIKEIERTTNHDVKAIEYFIKEQLQGTALEDLSEWIHFGATSEDINNLAYSILIRDGMTAVLLPTLNEVQKLLQTKCREWKKISLLARTHGQPASPTTLGKVFLNFFVRLQRQIKNIAEQEYLGKFNGATGNFNAHVAAFSKVDWLLLSKKLVEGLGLTWQPVSDQIEPHDFLAELAHSWVRINTILIHLARDTWGYISLGYFRQKIKAGEVGSSTMPHKVNPIDFENAEGNLGLANALWEFLAAKLPLTRWQRDLTDSTVLRNFGVTCGHTLLALKSLQKGLLKLEVNSEKIAADLEENMEVLAEAVQTVMRRYGLPKPYERLKELTRGQRLTRVRYEEFVKELEIPAAVKKDLLALTPATYIGKAVEIVESFGK